MNHFNPKLRALIIDDEMSGRTMIEYYLQENFGNDIEELKSVATLNEAVLQIPTFCPNIVFCDYELRGESGLDISKFLPPEIPLVVITAYSQYAITALRANVFDYILKPIEESEFLTFKKRLSEKWNVFYAPTNPLTNNGNETIVLKENGENIIVKHQEILYVEASGAYSKIVTAQRNFITSKTLKAIEAMLPSNFIRVHRSFLVPLAQINSFNSTQVCLKNGTYISLSKTGRKLLQDSL